MKGIYFHYVKVIEGKIQKSKALFEVNREKRFDITRNHSATHLLDQALKDVLGEDVKQAGSLVDENKLRFDFTYTSALSKNQIKKVEAIINEKIREQLPVTKVIMDYKDSEKIGAIGLFEDKYKDKVRVVSIGDYSKELCGGCHVNNSSEILIFKIVQESSVSSGVRRIEAITGKKVYELLVIQDTLLKNIAGNLSSNIDNILSKIASYKDEIIKQKEEIKKLKSSSNKDMFTDLKNSIKKVNDINLLVYKFEGTSMDDLRDLENRIKTTYKEGMIIVFATVNDGKIIFTVSVSDDLTQKYNAGKIVKEISQIAGGNGGGRKNFAQAGATDISKLDQALDKVNELIKEWFYGR